jgi:hypothetical protein
VNWHGWLVLASIAMTAYWLGCARGYSEANKMIRKAFKNTGAFHD